MSFQKLVKKAKDIKSNNKQKGLKNFLLMNGFEISGYEEALENWADEKDRFYKNIPEDLSVDEVKDIFKNSDVIYMVNYEKNYNNSAYIFINFIPIYTYNKTTGLLEYSDVKIFECDISDCELEIESISNNKEKMKELLQICEELKIFFNNYINLLNDLEKFGIKLWR